MHVPDRVRATGAGKARQKMCAERLVWVVVLALASGLSCGKSPGGGEQAAGDTQGEPTDGSDDSDVGGDTDPPGSTGAPSHRDAGPVVKSPGTDAAREKADAAVGNAGAQSDAARAPNVSDPGASVSTEDLIAAPDGVESAPGTLAAPTTLLAALTRVAPGRAIRLRGGSYTSAAQITIARDNSGEPDKLKELRAYLDEKPVLDFSSQPYGKDANPRGLQIDGSYWHVLGLTVLGSADNGIYVAGSHNVVENCILHKNRDTGLQIGRSGSSTAKTDWPADNLILNCESYDNYDAPPGGGENADGFAAKLTVGTGNVFRGCVSHNNIDDGWDLYTKTDTGSIGEVTIDQCVAHHNGTLTDGTANANGDRNGFKLGGEKIAVAHVVTRSIAFANGKNGFTWNSNPGAIRLSNTLAFDNVAGNYKFGDNSTQTSAVFSNNLSFWNSASGAVKDVHFGQDVDHTNCWANASASSGGCNGSGLMVSGADFAGSLANVQVSRAADGTPDLSVFKLAAKSALIDVGVLPAGDLPFDPAYYHGKPDLGAVESP